MRRAAGDVEIDFVLFDEVTRQKAGIRENPAADGAGAKKDDEFGLRHSVVGRFQRVRHGAGGCARNDKTIGMTGRGDELNAETTHIEIHIVERVQLQFATIATAGGNGAQLE